VGDKNVFGILPHFPKLSDKLQRILEKTKLKCHLQNSNKIQSCFDSGDDRTSPNLGSGVYRVPCSCGCFYVRRTYKQLEQRLSEHKSSVNKAMELRLSPDTFDSALAKNVYEN